MKGIPLLICLGLCSVCAIQSSRAQFEEWSLSPDSGLSKRAALLQQQSLRPSAPDLLHFSSPWSYGELGLFCKLDVVFERKLKFPVLLRLGDVQRVEAWEGKGAWRSVY